MKFSERFTLGLLGGSVIAAAVALWFHPPQAITVSPRAVFASPADPLAEIDLAMETAAGDPDSAITMDKERLMLPVVNPRAGASRLSDAFARIGYDLDSVVAGDERVPRLFLTSLPADIGDVRETAQRKGIFFKTVLPLILQVNEEIQAQRTRLWELRFKMRIGLRLRAVDRLWLMVMAERYKTKAGDIDTLLRRVDVIPPSLALAQAAEESGWGTSRFVREGNALFGQWVYTDKVQLKPRDRAEGERHQIMAFGSLFDAARAYALNLNTHAAYLPFRNKRWDMRRTGEAVDGYDLAGTLLRYSQRGQDYIQSLRTIISVNGLEGLDQAQLLDSGTAVASPAI